MGDKQRKRVIASRREPPGRREIIPPQTIITDIRYETVERIVYVEGEPVIIEVPILVEVPADLDVARLFNELFDAVTDPFQGHMQIPEMMEVMQGVISGIEGVLSAY